MSKIFSNISDKCLEEYQASTVSNHESGNPLMPVLVIY